MRHARRVLTLGVAILGTKPPLVRQRARFVRLGRAGAVYPALTFCNSLGCKKSRAGVNVNLRACKTGGTEYLQEVGQRYMRRMGIPMSGETPLVRQWMMLRTLPARHYGATVKEMAQDMGVS